MVSAVFFDPFRFRHLFYLDFVTFICSTCGYVGHWIHALIIVDAAFVDLLYVGQFVHVVTIISISCVFFFFIGLVIFPYITSVIVSVINIGFFDVIFFVINFGRVSVLFLLLNFGLFSHLLILIGPYFVFFLEHFWRVSIGTAFVADTIVVNIDILYFYCFSVCPLL